MSNRVYKIKIINPNFEETYKSLKEICGDNITDNKGSSRNSTTSNQSIKERERIKRIGIFGGYSLHPSISKVSFNQFQDGYFKEAIQNAFVEVINQVKKKAGSPVKEANGKKIELDGDDLMTRAFACDGRSPIIAFNSLNDSLDRAEQRGFQNIYKGIVGLRDKKAHLNFIQDDPIKTIEYLSFASLLLRLLDESTTNLQTNDTAENIEPIIK